MTIIADDVFHPHGQENKDVFSHSPQSYEYIIMGILATPPQSYPPPQK